MQKKIFRVTFKYSELSYCNNIAIAESENAVKKHYEKYDEVFVSEGTESDLNEANKKGKPIIEV